MELDWEWQQMIRIFASLITICLLAASPSSFWSAADADAADAEVSDAADAVEVDAVDAVADALDDAGS